MIAVALFALAALTAQPDPAAPILGAIAAVETGNNPAVVGKAGERGIYQFTTATWAQYSKQPLATAATDPVENERVARAHLAALQAGLERAGIEPTPFALAEAWNAGLGAVQRGRVPASTRDYAQRVVNLIEAKP